MSILSFKKNRSNEIIFTLNKNALKNSLKKALIQLIAKPLFNIVVSVHQTLEVITNKHVYLSLLMTLGLGFGFGLTVFRQPDSATAFPSIEARANGGIKIANLLINDLDIMVESGNSTQINFNQNVAVKTNLTKIGEHGPMLVMLHQKFQPVLKNINLGDKIKLVGENNGVYNYRVVETKLIKKENINKLLEQTSETVIIYAPMSKLSDQLYVLVAR